MEICYLGAGSNLGARRKNIQLAVKSIEALKGTEVIKVSRLFSSAACGGPSDQPRYLNAAIKIRTSLSPLTLLKKLKKIEKDLGRIRTVRFGPRLIDLDILLYGNRLVRTKKLTVPHPRMFARDFVVRPLFEVL